MGASLLSQDRLQTVIVVPETANGIRDAWEFDAVLSMTDSNPGQAFRHPLQNGQEGITDGTRLEPNEFQCEGVLTDTPVRYFLPRQHPGAVSLYEQIKSIRRQQVPVTVYTSWVGLLTSRWPQVITGTHGASEGASIRMTIQFVHFRLVRSQVIPGQVDSDVLLLGSQTTTFTQFASG